MIINVGTADRIVRITAWILLIALAAFGRIGPWGYIGLVPLATGVLRYCPAYSLIGLRTCAAQSQK